MISFGFVVCSRSVSAACAGWPSPSVASRLRPTACLCGPRGPQAFAAVATAGGNSASLESPAAVTSVSACGREWPVPPLAASLLASCGRRSLSFRVACAFLGSSPSASCGRRSLFMPTKLLIKSETDKDFKFFE